MFWLWAGFLLLVLLLLALDLGVFHRHARAPRLREAAIWSLVWVLISLSFNCLVYFIYEQHWFGADFSGGRSSGTEAAISFFTGYLLEKALSVDNIFVMAMLFKQFKVAGRYQHRVLFWGILGAIISRGLMIGVGVFLVKRFSWLFYVFGAYLAFAGVRILLGHDDDAEFDPERNAVLRVLGRVIPITDGDHQGRFFGHTASGGRAITRLMVALLVIEFMDVVFALDSVPAVLAITTDSFIVMTSNIFAILGLRAMYFVLASMLDQFRHLQPALALILIVIGAKMLLHSYVDVPTSLSLLVIGSLLVVGVLASLLDRRHK